MLDLLKHWRILGVAGLALVASHACTYAKGHHDGSASEKRAEAVRLERARKLILKREAKAETITQSVKSDLAKTQVQIRYRTRYLTEKVTVYVPATADADCRLPVGFRLLHDAAAQGGEAVVPGASGELGKPDPELTLSAATEVVVANYGEFHQLRAEVTAWREWYRQQARAWEARP